MTIIIKVEGDTKQEEMTFSNDRLDNDNCVDMTVGEKEYTLSIKDLFVVVNAFNDLKWQKVVNKIKPQKNMNKHKIKI
ncbi:MAG TPA: hypothetical protein ENH20_01495 [Candidatus Pacearchaeota archaeon]|nr:hypothetical protein [Candidatus Pacearchaeota archaeon]